MSGTFVRADRRKVDQLRSVHIEYGVCGNADASVLFCMGNTKVLCTIVLQDGVPPFLRGKKEGWLTAEYSMLPASTHTRTVREAAVMKRSSRSLEISRLIGRSLRSVVDLTLLGERTIYIDCDVIQADGGTRTAAITGTYCALLHAVQNRWQHFLKKEFLKDSIAAVSVGWKEGVGLLDLDFEEDSSIDADFNFVITGSGRIIEVQGTAEKVPLTWDAVAQMYGLASVGVRQLFEQLGVSDMSSVAPAAGFKLGLTLAQR